MKKAVVLLSGGMDSTTTLAVAKSQGFLCHALTVSYGQRHHAELEAARRIAKSFGVVEHRLVQVDFNQWGGSALTDRAIEVPNKATASIPVTYVPARNTIFLALALSWAEVIDAYDLFIGVNAIDYSGYPDCRPLFIEAFENLANVATKKGVEGHTFKVQAPLLTLSKAEIVHLGKELGVDFAMTVTCYQADDNGRACGVCEACQLRRQGFLEAGLDDPTIYYR
jgi:7-cyano-7-deazaguanine synthase